MLFKKDMLSLVYKSGFTPSPTAAREQEEMLQINLKNLLEIEIFRNAIPHN